MEITREAEEQIVRYILGELSPEEADDLESAYFVDDDYFEHVQAVEAELIRNFIKGAMPPDLRVRFEKRYRESPELARKVGFARVVAGASRDLRQATQPAIRQVERSSWIRRLFGFDVPHTRSVTAVAAATIVIVVLVVWKDTRSKPEIAQVNAPVPRPPVVEVQPEQRPSQPKGERSSPERVPRPAEKHQEQLTLLASIILQPGLTRDERQPQSVRIPRGRQGSIEFQMPLPSGIDYSEYQVVLQKLGGPTILTSAVPGKDVRVSDRTVGYSVSAGLLPAGQYVFHLKGRNAPQGNFDEVQYYVFAVPQ